MNRQSGKWAAILLMIAALVKTGAVSGSDGRTIYLIALNDAPLVEEMITRAAAMPSAAHMDRQMLRQVLAGPQSKVHLAKLDNARKMVVDMASRTLGRRLEPAQVYTNAINGMALELTSSEAEKVARLPGVAKVRPERFSQVHTDAGPQWIGANLLWSGDAGLSTKGEGVVIGIVDTGINSTHPSFAATGGDGYTHTNPREGFLGMCANGSAICNNKLIGIYDFSNEFLDGSDASGHGSLVAAVAAGNQLSTKLHFKTTDLVRNVSGVAPHANLVSYKVCSASANFPPLTGPITCAGSSLIKAIDQAIADQVDVLNYSIGSYPGDPYELMADHTSVEYALFQARAAGIVIVASVGNSGPGGGTISSSANAPWVLGVASATHNRRFANSVVGISGSATGSPFTDLTGWGYTAGYGPAPIVYAGDYGNAICATGFPHSPPDGSTNPWPAGTFHGEIVVCDGTVNYVPQEPGYNLKAAGAGGMIVANSPLGDSLNYFDHYLPAVNLDYSTGNILKNWIRTAAPLRGSISGVKAAIQNEFGDVLDATSSRGPYGFTGGVLKPDLTAPGENILSANGIGTNFVLATGTSLASPNVAGSAGLVLAAHRDWTPAQIESALTGTALAGSVRKEDGEYASPNEAGAGRVQPAAAVNAGLYLPLSAADFIAHNPHTGGNLRDLNRSGVEDEHCFQQCHFSRTVTDMSGGGAWKVNAVATDGVKVSVVPSEFSLEAGASQTLSITVDVSDPRLWRVWTDGQIVLHKTGGGTGASDFVFTLSAYADAGESPQFNEFQVYIPTGSIITTLEGMAPLPRARYESTELTKLDDKATVNLGGSNDAGTGYSDFIGSGKKLLYFRNPVSGDSTSSPGASAFVAEVNNVDIQSTTMYVGIDSDADGLPSPAETLCWTATAIGPAAPVARCIIDLRAANLRSTLEGRDKANVWVVIGGQPSPKGGYRAAFASTFLKRHGVDIDATQGADTTVTGPGQVPARASFPMRLTWGGTAKAGRKSAPLNERFYGAILIDSVPGAPGPFLPYALTYLGGGDDQHEALSLNGMSFNSGVSGSFHYVHVDVPPGVDALTVDSSYTSADPAATMRVDLVRADFPDFSSSAQIAPAPTTGSAVSWTLTPSASSKSVSVPAESGRWYLLAQTDGPEIFTLTPTFKYNEVATRGITPGAYYNPQRSGHGIFLSQTNDQQLVNWYTYLEDGTPTWYSAQGKSPVPAGAVWTAPLHRVNWSGAAANSSTEVGNVTLTRINDSDFIFSWHLDGQSGSERFTRLGTGSCPDFNGVAKNFSGAWYAPVQSGYGLDVLAMPDQFFTTIYFYDALGIARWGVGSTQPSTADNTIGLTQSSGFCPLCAYRKATAQALGSMRVELLDANNGNLSTNLTLQLPLSGGWTVDRQRLARLTGSPDSCTP